MEWVLYAFWSSVILLLYTFVGYPLMIAVLALVRPRTMQIQKTGFLPTVSFIIAAHNEEAIIGEKIRNCLALDYPQEKLQVIIASDCSSDRTDEIVAQYKNTGVELVRLTERGGKIAAQNLAASTAKGEILTFSDSSTMLHPSSLKKMVRNFADGMVGCVSGEDKSVSTNRGRPEDEGLYVKYEMAIRRWESKLGSIVGASGCFFSLRRNLWTPQAEFHAEDFSIPLAIREQGFRTITEPQAVVYVKTVTSADSEFARRVRAATHGLAGLLWKKRLLNPFRFGFFSIQLISHKILRFVVPFVLIVTFITNAMLVQTGFLYALLFILQVAFYACAGIGFLLRDRLEKPRIVSFPFYFVIVNAAILTAWWRIIQGQRTATWEPSLRRSSLKVTPQP
jgi:cellulose synthase/poly-beta-1,6-N-acetylglucosamine synthase-like glycosyltransferase